MKLKVVSNYDNDHNMFVTMNNCYSNNTQIVLTEKDDYDYLLVINGCSRNINVSRDRVFGLLQEPIGNINYDRNLHFYCSKIFCQSSSMFKSYKGIVETPIHMFYSHHTFVNKDYFTNYNSISNRKKLCIIVSSLNAPNNLNWNSHNYTKRHKLVNKLLQSDLDFDFYGRGWHNIADSRYKGVATNKHEILRQYEYSIAIENSCEANYASEKIFDCFLNNTVPLYYGCPNISELYDKNSYELLDLESPLIIEEIKNIINSSNEKYKDHLFKSKEKYFNNYNIFNLIEKNIK
jgi:hypothetical protein